MRARSSFRDKRRSGISNLVGAVFFVLIVALVLSTLLVMFSASSGFILGIHTANQAAQQAANSNVAVSSVAFGGELARGSADMPVNGSIPQPLLPVRNSNFTGSMVGWYVSKSYPSLVDGATVVNALQSNGSAYIEQLDIVNPETFLLTVTNNSPLGSGNGTGKISILVDGYFSAPAWGSCVTLPTCSGWSLLPAVGNNLTLTAPAVDDLSPGQTAQLTWTAVVPLAAGIYHDTVVLYWHSASLPAVPYSDYGIVTATTTIASPLPLPNLAAPILTLSPRTPGISPGGLIGGYDANAVTTDSSSGPGSVFTNFEPNFGGQRLPAGQELSAGIAFTTTFSLNGATICQLRANIGACSDVCPSNCFMVASVSSSLDEVASQPNSLVYYHVQLVNPSGSVFVINPGGTDPTTANHFAPSGWTEQSTQFAPPAAFWVPGDYKFEIVVNMTMPSGLPSQISMHFDDLGVALNLETPLLGTGGSTYGVGTIPLSFVPLISYNQAQEVTVGLNMSISSSPSQPFSNTVAYVYAAANPVRVLGQLTATSWYEIASVTFNGSASANALIPLPQSTGFVSGTGQVILKVVTISIGTGASCIVAGLGMPNCSMLVSAYAVSQAANTAQAFGRAVFTLTNPEGAAAVHLVALYFSGPNGTLPANNLIGSTNGIARFTINNWVTAGSTVVLYEDLFGTQNFSWIPGQVYEVTAISVSGTSYSASFTAP